MASWPSRRKSGLGPVSLGSGMALGKYKRLANSRMQLSSPEGLRDRRGERDWAHHLLRLVDYEHNRDDALGAYLLNGLDACSSVDLVVGCDQVGAAFFSRFDRLFDPVYNVERCIAEVPQLRLDQRRDQELIFDDERVHRSGLAHP